MQCVYSFILFTSLLLHYCFGFGDELSCINNEGEPVDWWYLYKPPLGDLEPLRDRLDYQYFHISSKEGDQRWMSNIEDIDKSMVTKTLAPLYKISSVKKLAVTTFTRRKGRFPDDSSSAEIGVLIADDHGGVYMGHTVPGYPDLTADFPKFPEEELRAGHLFVCLSLTLMSVNKMAEVLNLVSPRFVHTRVPANLGQLLPGWKFNREMAPPVRLPERLTQELPDWDIENNRRLFESTHPQQYVISTKGGVRGVLLYKRNKMSEDVYRRFAISKLLVLDVYGRTREPISSECTRPYSIRNINKISIKQRDEAVLYITKDKDHTRFAVNTAAHWQQNGSSSPSYWACTSHLDKEDKRGVAGMLLCMDNYHIWNCFDNLKAHEPQCF